MFGQTRFSIGIGVGGYGPSYYPAGPSYESRAYAYERPPCPGPDYSWTDGYWDQNRGRRTFIVGSWVRRPYSRGYITPRYERRDYGDRYNDTYGREYDRRYYEQQGNWETDVDSDQDRYYDRGYEQQYRNGGNYTRYRGR